MCCHHNYFTPVEPIAQSRYYVLGQSIGLYQDGVGRPLVLAVAEGRPGGEGGAWPKSTALIVTVTVSDCMPSRHMSGKILRRFVRLLRSPKGKGSPYPIAERIGFRS